MRTIEPAIAALVRIVISGRIGELLPASVVASELVGCDQLTVTEARIRISGHQPGTGPDHITWLNFDRLDSVKGTSVHFTNSQGVDRSVVIPSQDEVPGLFVRTNDGEPGFSAPSYYGSTPLRFAGNLVGHMCEFLADQLRHLDRVELLLQISVAGQGSQQFPTNLVTDSDAGWERLQRQPELFTD